MGSHPTLDQQDPAAEALEVHSDDWAHGHAVAHLGAEHPQLRARSNDNPDPTQRDRIYDHPHVPTERAAEQTFDQLNPNFGVPADRSDLIGHRDVVQREAALALGIRVAVHDSRQNDPNPLIWQPGQDYRMADALHAARAQPTRTRRGPERLGPER
jgi:hypothetical protein